jgi:hypothetical protein
MLVNESRRSQTNFQSISAYNKLLMSTEFWRLFDEEYILIFQVRIVDLQLITLRLNRTIRDFARHRDKVLRITLDCTIMLVRHGLNLIVVLK